MGYSLSHPRNLVAIVLITVLLLAGVDKTDQTIHGTGINCCTTRFVSIIDYWLGASNYKYCMTFDMRRCSHPSPPPPPPPRPPPPPPPPPRPPPPPPPPTPPPPTPPSPPDTTPRPPPPPPTDGCRNMDDKAGDCYSKTGCVFVCADRRCDNANNYVTGDKVDCPAEGGCCCSQYCYDVKTCKKSGCEYEVLDGNCRQGPQSCFPELFDENNCARGGENVFYTNDGMVCKSHDTNGTCKLQIRRVITAVNFNGKENFTSEDGITYVPHTRVEVEDPNKLTDTVGQTVAPIEGIRNSDTPLYGTYVLGNHTKYGICANYTFIVENDGQFELSIKLQEPKYDERGKRFFSIWLNEMLVAPEIDLIAYAGKKNKGMDLNIKFSLSNQRSQLKLIGFPATDPPSNSDKFEKMTLSFCRGRIENVDNDFALTGFSVVEIGGLNCEALNKDPCKCVDTDGCEYNSMNQLCVEAQNCSKIMEDTEECRRSKAYYAVGSLLCKNDIERGRCKEIENVWAVNFNGPTYADSRGILFQGEATVADLVHDENDLRLDVDIKENCPEVFGVSEPDAKNLYSTVVTGPPDGNEGCILYPLPICKDGRYELAIKTVEYLDHPIKTRRFNVKINNIVVLVEVDLMKLSKRCEPTEFIILFEVDDSGKTLRIEGHEEERIDQPELELQFCYGGGGEDEPCNPTPPNRAFLMSAYSVVRLGPLTKTSGKCLQSTNVCECKHRDCEFNTVDGTCANRKQECAHCNFEPNECRRAGAWYANAAVLCKNALDRGNCIIDKKILGVNMGGMQHIGRKGIVHKSYTSVPPTNRDNGQEWKKTDGMKLMGIPPEDILLYASFGTGSAQKTGVVRTGRCASYDVPISFNGNYELSIKVGDYLNQQRQKKSINYKFNGVRLVHELDVRAHTKSRRHAMELNINFKVTGGGESLHLRGHPITPIVGKKISLEFCYGECSQPGLFIDDTWMVSSWSIVKFKDDPAGGNQCGSGKPGSVPHPCSAHFEKPCECKKAGCEYNVNDKQCVPGGRACEHCEANVRKSVCQRKDAFYVTGGVVCRNTKARGNCEFNDTVIAVNFGTMGYTDENGIVYKSYLAAEGNIPLGTSVGPKAPIRYAPGVDQADRELYETYVFANPAKPNSKSCLGYNIRFKSDGEYEFSVKILEYEYTEPGKRSFTIKLNGVVIVKELDILRLTGKEQNVMNLAMNFNVTDQRRTLVLPGYPSTSMTNGKVIVEFCNGACNGPSTLWTLTAFSVLRFGIPGNTNNDTCRSSDKNLCECVGNLCQFKSSTEECVGTPKFVNYYGADDDCRWESAYYSDGGIISRNPQSIGNCEEQNTVFGGNLGGKTYYSNDGLQYVGENELNPAMIKDPHKIRRQFELNCKAIVDGTTEDAVMLYRTATGSATISEKSLKCFSYTIPLCADGRYALLIRSLVDDWSKSSSKRINVKFGSHWVFREIDLNQLSGRSCKPIELVSLFEVDNESRLLRVQGFPNTNITSSETTLKFCHSECVADSFQASAFSISRFGDPLGGAKDSCGTYDDSCSCVKGLCNFQSGSKKCTKRKLYCPICDYSVKTKWDCRRADSYYVDGTGICRNAHDRGNCSLGEVIKAVNMNGPQVISSIGIKHEEFESAKPDMNGDNLEMATDDLDDNNVPEQDRVLYQSFVYSKEIDSPCMTYNVKITEDGLYELAVKTWDNSNSETGKRTMNIRLNNITIVQDLDLVFIAGPRIAVNLITNFEVVESVGGLRIAGFEDSIIVDDIVPLEICHGMCRPNIGWILSAFSIIRLGLGDTGETGGCSAFTNGSDNEPDACSLYGNNPCECRKAGCEYNTMNEKCIPGPQVCASCEKNTNGTECRRSNAFYVHAGVACRNEMERGSCLYSKTILAVTFGKNELVDSQGIVYRPFSDIQPNILPQGSMSGHSKNILTDPAVPPEDKTLYQSFIFANPRKPAATECLQYNVKLETGGEYELSLRFFEYINNSPGKRAFVVKINGMVVIQGLDIIQLIGRMQNALNIIFNFELDETLKTIRLAGFPPSSLLNDAELTIELCNGACGGRSRIWTLSAFSVLKFEQKTL